MFEMTIGANESGKRLDKLLNGVLINASDSFVHKMLRKKNIVLNGKKADGSERLYEGDVVSFFFAEETLRILTGGKGSMEDVSAYIDAYRTLKSDEEDEIRTLYEDDHIILLHKPAGILSQQAKNEPVSLNEWLVGYLLENGSITADTLKTFRPSVANRLDRNTTGIIIGTKSLKGAVSISELIRTRSLLKTYHAIVCGILEEGGFLNASWEKDRRTNRITLREVTVTERIPPDAFLRRKMCTQYVPVACNAEDNVTLLECNLITGKTHQLRVGLSAIGFPILGDPKYGSFSEGNSRGIHRQLLHASRLTFPDEMPEPLEALSGRFFADDPDPLFAAQSRTYFG